MVPVHVCWWFPLYNIPEINNIKLIKPLQFTFCVVCFYHSISKTQIMRGWSCRKITETREKFDTTNIKMAATCITWLILDLGRHLYHVCACLSFNIWNILCKFFMARVININSIFLKQLLQIRPHIAWMVIWWSFFNILAIRAGCRMCRAQWCSL